MRLDSGGFIRAAALFGLPFVLACQGGQLTIDTTPSAAVGDGAGSSGGADSGGSGNPGNGSGGDGGGEVIPCPEACAPGSACAEGECQKLACTRDPCPDGSFCSAFALCVPNGGCLDASDCDAGICSVTETCIPAGECRANGDCGSSERCADQRCIAERTCATDDECSASLECREGRCEPRGGCEADADCTGTEQCAQGLCIGPGRCLEDVDCPAAQRCGAGQSCILPGECAADSDCPAAFRCDSGGCVPDGTVCTARRSSRGCTATELLCCPAGEACCGGSATCSVDNGVCLPEGACVSDADCRAGFEECSDDYRCMPTLECPCAAGQRCSEERCIPEDGCLSSLDCSAGAVCAEGVCVPSDSCGATIYDATRVPANVMVLLDRSGSMNFCAEGDLGPSQNAQETTRWEEAKAVLNQVLPSTDDALRWGLTAFPEQCIGTTACIDECVIADQPPPGAAPGAADNCNGTHCPVSSNAASTINRIPADAPLTSPSAGNAAGVLALLEGLEPGGATPAAPTLRNIEADPALFGLNDPERENVILYLTDGQPNGDAAAGIPRVGGGECGSGFQGEDAACKVNSALASLRELEPSISTYVVGFAIDQVADAELVNDLKCFAVTGGTSLCDPSVGYPDCDANDTPTCHYLADDQSALESALLDITGRVASCSFRLGQIPPDPSRVFVFLEPSLGGNKVLVPRADDGTPNWSYDALTRQVRFVGAVCERVKQGASPLIVYGCPELGG